MPLALDNLRVGRIYRLVNQGEVRKIEVMARLSGEDFFVKDLLGNTIYSQKVQTKIGANSIPFYRDELESGMYIYSIKWFV